ncbi:hypothetical protein E6C27_scaffold120G00250 [Cucumis melo var. makuwa]|uniref:Alpha 1,4-glycosyltransferase domain-containing protein n=1 Tax=Cucumis melo var. makuwa TaxID=1194695 RepID=A0A5A7UG17_CUCMM|nr:hypothetical protein E6C27_scaffold120G00250 [Cucumis melo var. makuwa]
MLRNLHTRRRGSYGACFCAFAAALLLLFSVSLLYTRLSRSQSHTYSHHMYPKSLGNILVSDSDDDSDIVLGTTTTDEDKIDELDFVDEDLQSRASGDEDLGEDEDQSDQVRVSGFYFDHVSGAIRKVFDNKRSIEDWSDDTSGFPIGLGEVDRSKSAFGSDDVPVDEEVRRKASEMTGIEDALLLKVGGRVSPLRDGWGDWFDKKGDFLRRDRMFKSNWEVLNPLNNPLLQDPDGLGVPSLTRGDRIVQKWWINEFKRAPFLVNKPVGVTRKVFNTEVENGGMHASIKKSGSLSGQTDINLMDNGKKTVNEIGTSDEHAGNNLSRKKVINFDEDSSSRFSGYRTSISRSTKNEKSGDRSTEKADVGDKPVLTKGAGFKPRAVSHTLTSIYADGKRWGYYPGLHPHLSFSRFMDAFFKKNKCEIRVFMVWNSPPWMFGVRHQRGLESVFLHHQDACVVIFSETIELDFFRDNFVKNGYKVAVAMPNLDELLKDTPTHKFASIWFEWKKTKFYSTHYSELVRLAALYKYGGIYLDSDIVVLKPLSSLHNSVGMEDQLAGSSLNGAVMAFRRHSPFIMECMKEYYSTYDDRSFRWNGAELLTRVAKRFSSEVPAEQFELTVQPSFAFFPIASQNITSNRFSTLPHMHIYDGRHTSQKFSFSRKILCFRPNMLKDSPQHFALEGGIRGMAVG